ncbi:hypothetical protein [Streptosporangium sandarakinum]|uniref:hypothetical protein n=1 Tax=Streptosporangium sandarakinum TaxID=1260955 RepID=UPI00379A0E3C
MSETVQSPAPCPKWCVADHTTDTAGQRLHLAYVGPFSGPGEVMLRYAQADTADGRTPVVVHLSFLSEGRRYLTDIDWPIAMDWSRILAGLDIRSLGEFAAALSKVAERTMGDEA